MRMPEESAVVVLACGFVDLRKGIDGLATIIGDRYGQNHLKRERCSSSAETTGPVQRAAVDGHGFRPALQAV